MPEISAEVVSLINYLIPGFLAAWVFYGLTSHEKPSQFERIIQALIFTVVIKTIVLLGSKVALFLGHYWRLGTWDSDTELIWSLITALVAGLGVSFLANKDILYNALRRCKFTNKSAHPNEWSDVLSKYPRYVVLHLEGERRLFGWPEVWPSNPKNGHFFIVYPSWLTEAEGCENYEIRGVEGVLVDVNQVQWVEVMGESKEQ